MWTQGVEGPIPAPLTIERVPDGDGGFVDVVTAWKAGYRVIMPAALFDTCDGLDRYAVSPESPQRVFAGDEPPWPLTAFLRFEDEVEARTVLAAFWSPETD